MSQFSSHNFAGQKALVRVDFNVPLDKATQAITEYVNLAKRHQLSAAQFALAFVNSRPFVSSTLIGATTLDQLKENINSINVSLSDEILNEIDAIHLRIQNPAP